MDLQASLQRRLAAVLQQICEKKDAISIEASEDDRGFLLLVSVDESDMGKVIGKKESVFHGCNENF